MTAPINPSFLAHHSANSNNVTGDGTAYKVVCDNVIYDNYNQYDRNTGIFTVLIERVYVISGSVSIGGVGVQQTSMEFYLITTNGNYRWFSFNVPVGTVGGSYSASFSQGVFLRTGDTAYLEVIVMGTSKTVDVLGSSSPLFTHFSATMIP